MTICIFIGNVTLEARKKVKFGKLKTVDWLVVIGSLLISTFIMVKTFKGGGDGTLFVGSNEIFDFGHALSIIRSFSLGENIPFLSPFVSGTPHLYHFLFYFWVAIYEYFGVSLVWALNSISIISFSLLLLLVYLTAQMLFKKRGTSVGIIAVILTVMHSTLTFFYYIFEKGISFGVLKNIWQMQKYYFAGPYDSSIISINQTLNVFVNQRHLAFSLAVFLFTVILLHQAFESNMKNRKVLVVIGILIGLLPLWNMFIWGVSIAYIFLWCIFERKLLRSGWIFIPLVLTSVLSFLPWLSYIPNILYFSNHGSITTSRIPYVSLWDGLYKTSVYWVQNLGMSLITILGFFVVSKRNEKKNIVPFILLFLFLWVCRIAGYTEADQKIYNAVILGLNLASAYFLIWLWDHTRFKVLPVFIFFCLTVSGIFDLFVIKNEYTFPIIGKEDVEVQTFIKSETNPKDVFLSYADIVDPVTLSGRRNFNGFYKNILGDMRVETGKHLFESSKEEDLQAFKKYGISYVLLPKWEKTDFFFSIKKSFFDTYMDTAYEDGKYVIYRVRSEE